MITSLAAMFIGMAKGGVPTIGMLAMPLISLTISPIKGAALLLPIFILSDIVSVSLYRKSISLRNIKILIPAGFIGVFLGWATASHMSEQAVSVLIGALGICFCLFTWLGKSMLSHARPARLKGGLFWGALAGYTSFISHAGSPPYQIYTIPQKLEKLTFIGTTAIVFAAINLAKAVPYYSLSPYSSVDITLTLYLIPSALMGIFLGAYLIKRLPESGFFKLIQIGLLAISIKLIWQSM